MQCVGKQSPSLSTSLFESVGQKSTSPQMESLSRSFSGSKGQSSILPHKLSPSKSNPALREHNPLVVTTVEIAALVVVVSPVRGAVVLRPDVMVELTVVIESVAVLVVRG